MCGKGCQSTLGRENETRETVLHLCRLNQIAAVRSALDASGVELLTQHLETCVLGHGSGSEHHCARPMGKEELLAEVQTALNRFLK
jgi:DNA-binding FrmR family transcriptional regulator